MAQPVFFKHPGVLDCAVIGIPDPLLGEEIAAFVKLREGESLTTDDLEEFSRGKIAGFKQLKKIFLLSELDGLDEIRDLAHRQMVAQRVVELCARNQQRGNKLILTGDIAGYGEVRCITEGMAECVLEEFGADEIARFVDTWTWNLVRATRGDTLAAAEEAARLREELLDAVHRRPGVRSLAASPLLLAGAYWD